jgi:hypothetical protein
MREQKFGSTSFITLKNPGKYCRDFSFPSPFAPFVFIDLRNENLGAFCCLALVFFCS